MYIPSFFRESDHDQLLEIVESCGLALLVTQGPDGMLANHLPLLLIREGEQATLQGHLAKANPQWQHLATGAPALVVFSGPEAYVSPGSYPSKQDNPAVVPTWNYISVQARGIPEVFHTPDRLYALVAALTRRHEATRPLPWAIEDAPPAYIEGMLKAIVGFSLPIEQLHGKRKLSQNRSAADQQGVAQHLSTSERSTERELGAAMTDNHGPF